MSSVIRASAVAFLTSALALSACYTAPKPRTTRAPVDMRDHSANRLHPALADTIGEYTIFADAAPLHVEGYGIVAQLPGTGSSDMPPSIHAILVDQLSKAGAGSYVGGTQDIDPEKILASNLVAAVEIHGAIPPMARVGTSFDLTVTCIPSSQATSLAGGLLWPGDLKIIGLTADTGVDTHRIAIGRGPVFVGTPVQAAMGQSPTTQPANAQHALRVGYVLGGGRVAEARPIRLQLYQPSLRIPGVIERAINSRFPARDKIASAESESIVNLKIPVEFQENPGEFISVVQHMFMSQETPGFSERKAAELIKALSDPKAPRKDISIALQALGRSVLLDYIQPQYTNPDPVVRFWCARAGAGLRDVGGMVVLQEFSQDEASPFRKEAVASIIDLSRGGDTLRATLTLTDMLKSKDIAERIAAYEGLVAIHSQAIQYTSVGGGKFYMDIVPCDAPPLIYVTQRDAPRIAIIGRSIGLPSSILYVSPDNALTVSVADDPPRANAGHEDSVLTASAVGAAPPTTAPAPKENVTLYWRSPFGDRDVEVTSTSYLPAVIARLGWAPNPKAPGYDPKAKYIGAFYQRISEMLASLCKDQTLQATFVLQKPPEETFKTPTDVIGGARPKGAPADLPPARPAAPAATTAPAPAAPALAPQPAPEPLKVAPPIP